MNWEYAAVLAATLFFPLILSRDPELGLYRHAGALALTLAAVAVPYWIWDVVATARGHWSFNPEYTLGAGILGMPVEEWLFFLVVPFVAIFTWESTKYFLRRRG
jgi:lycopene cyclase domain-containing protein